MESLGWELCKPMEMSRWANVAYALQIFFDNPRPLKTVALFYSVKVIDAFSAAIFRGGIIIALLGFRFGQACSRLRSIFFLSFFGVAIG